jgi:putative transposase
MIGLARGTFYAKPHNVLKNKDNLPDIELRAHIERLHVEFPGYGYRRIYHALRKTGTRVNAKRIRRVMNEHCLKPILYRTFKVATTDSAHNHRIYPNLIKGKETIVINEIWVTDLTYIRLRKEFIYLAVILDRHSRKVIGWAISRSLRKEVCLAALRDAITKRKPPHGCIHHSDRGVQYACNEYVDLLRENGFMISMSAKGIPMIMRTWNRFSNHSNMRRFISTTTKTLTTLLIGFRTILMSFTISVDCIRRWVTAHQKSSNKAMQGKRELSKLSSQPSPFRLVSA